MDFASARRHMVDSQVRTNDVTDLRLQQAMETTPRELFLPADLKEQAYIEREIDYAPGRWLLTARDFAKLVAAAEPRETDIVLNVVCGSGYSTAILAQLVEMVVSIESDQALATSAENNLNEIGQSNAAVLVTDPANGAAKQGPFDLIFLGAAIEVEPTALLSQLQDGGRLATILRKDGVSKGVLYTRRGETVSMVECFDATSRAIVPGFEAPKTFTF